MRDVLVFFGLFALCLGVAGGYLKLALWLCRDVERERDEGE